MTILDNLEDCEWTTRDGRTLTPEQMDASHRRNLLNWLLRRSRAIKMQYEIKFISYPESNGEMASWLLESSFDNLLEQDAEEWLMEQPLVSRLIELVVDDEDPATLNGPAQEAS